MAAAVQLNIRIDPELKRRGDAVFARAGLTPSQVVRALWQAAADTQQVPACVMPSVDSGVQERLDAVHRGAGLLTSMMEELGLPLATTAESFDYKTHRDQMYDEMICEMEERHV